MFSQNVKNRFRKWRFLLKTLCMKITEKWSLHRVFVRPFQAKFTYKT
jgi:hypothetical protein